MVKELKPSNITIASALYDMVIKVLIYTVAYYASQGVRVRPSCQRLSKCFCGSPLERSR